jgi:hypothetical protein
MQNQVVKVMAPERLGPQERKVIVHVFIWEILAIMTQVSDVAPGPLVLLWGGILVTVQCCTVFVINYICYQCIHKMSVMILYYDNCNISSCHIFVFYVIT